MFLRLPQHSAYDDNFFWSGECRDNEVRLYMKNICSEYQQNFGTNSTYKGMDLIDFELPCTLFVDYNASHDVFLKITFI